MSEKRLQKRDEISDEYKWKLEDMYETDELWEAECEKASQLAEKLSGFKGHLADSAATLLDFFKKQDELSYYLERIVVYANERSHQDTAVSKYQAYVSKAETLTVQASGALAFASPEILQIDDKRLESFYSESNELMHYKRAIDEIMRQKSIPYRLQRRISWRSAVRWLQRRRIYSACSTMRISNSRISLMSREIKYVSRTAIS